MISPTISINVEGLAEAMGVGQRVAFALNDKTDLYAVLAAAGELFCKKHVKNLSRHKTAARLQAQPTQHLQTVSTGIEGESDNNGASISIPRASRLRAAFGPYTVRPTGNRTYVSIPMAAATYGKSAGEYKGPTALIRCKGGNGYLIVEGEEQHTKSGKSRMVPVQPVSLLFALKLKVEIPEDRTLLPFDTLPNELGDRAGAYLYDIAKKGGTDG
jgi:hypothetical protein